MLELLTPYWTSIVCAFVAFCLIALYSKSFDGADRHTDFDGEHAEFYLDETD